MTELGRVTTLEAIVQIAKVRRRHLGLSQIELDDIAGLQTGYTGKLECGDKGLGKLSLPLLLGALRLELAIMPGGTQHPAGTLDHHREKQAEWGRQGRRKQLATQTKRHRKRIARHAANARWSKVKAAPSRGDPPL